MEAAGATQPDAGGFMRAVTKIVRFRRTTGRERNGVETSAGVVSDEGGFRKVKFPEYLDEGSVLFKPDYVEEDDEKSRRQQQLRHREATESFLAEIFAIVSAIKAAYAQLQIAESPYDPAAIQSADDVVVSELKRLSQLKRWYLKRHIHGGGGDGDDHRHQPSGRDARLLAEMQEQRNLLRTFKITAKKLEQDLQRKDAEIILLRNQLSESVVLGRWMEEKIHPHRSLHTLDGLHLSALGPTHLLGVLRWAVRSIRSFVKLMAKEMEGAGWDLDAAAGSIAPDVLFGRPEHRVFAFEAYVCRTMFSGFQQHDFDLCGGDGGRPLPDRRQFFDEFVELKSQNPTEILSTQMGESPFAMFCRAKYLSLVHPRMEGPFFGNLDQRTLISSDRGFPGTEFFRTFAEMARRIWLLHRLFLSFPPEAQASIFQVQRGCRFSEVYMESVAEDSDLWVPAVGFTVVPGFQVGKAVIQCRVYPARAAEQR